MKRVERPDVREGYDLWSATYDDMPNPLVALDRRYTMGHLRPQAGERILDAGCGTGANLANIARAGGRAVGVDFSRGMLRQARRRVPQAALVQADLGRGIPVRRACFDAALCALVSEHLRDIRGLFVEVFAALRDGGRFVFSAFHPEMAAAGVEASFDQDGVEYRLGAVPYTTADYLESMRDAGFRALDTREYVVDASVVEAVPKAQKHEGRPLLLVIEASRPGEPVSC